MSEHTPGPWQPRFIYRMIRAARKDPNLLIAADPANDWADARLMAAAPDLLEALRTLVDYYDQAGIGPCREGRDDVDADDGFSGDERCNVRWARKAILRATKETTRG